MLPSIVTYAEKLYHMYDIYFIYVFNAPSVPFSHQFISSCLILMIIKKNGIKN